MTRSTRQPTRAPAGADRPTCWREILQAAFDGMAPPEYSVETLIDRFERLS